MRDTDKAGKATEELAEVTRESYRIVVDRAFAARESNARLARNFFEETIEAYKEQVALQLRTVDQLAEQARERQGIFEELSRESFDAYQDFVSSLYDYQQDTLQKGPGR